MKCLIFGGLVLIGGCTPEMEVAETPTPTPPPSATAPAVPTPPVVIPTSIPTAPSLSDAVTSADGSRATRGEMIYIDDFQKVFDLITKAESRLKNDGATETNISLSLAEISSATDYHRRMLFVPPRFIEADNYLSQGLLKERIALTKQQMGVSGSDEYVAAGELFRQSLTSMKKQVQEMKAGR